MTRTLRRAGRPRYRRQRAWRLHGRVRDRGNARLRAILHARVGESPCRSTPWSRPGCTEATEALSVQLGGGTSPQEVTRALGRGKMPRCSRPLHQQPWQLTFTARTSFDSIRGEQRGRFALDLQSEAERIAARDVPWPTPLDQHRHTTRPPQGGTHGGPAVLSHGWTSSTRLNNETIVRGPTTTSDYVPHFEGSARSRQATVHLISTPRLRGAPLRVRAAQPTPTSTRSWPTATAEPSRSCRRACSSTPAEHRTAQICPNEQALRGERKGCSQGA